MDFKQTRIHVDKDEWDEIVFSITVGDDFDYLVEALLLDNTDTFSIRAYDTIHNNVNPYNANEVMHGLFDSDGGTFEGFEIEVNLEEDDNEERMKNLEEMILTVLFDNEIGLINKYSYSIEED